MIREETLAPVTDRLLGTTEAAEALGVHRTTLARWVRRYGLKPALETMGGNYLWDLEDLRRQLQEAQKERRREWNG